MIKNNGFHNRHSPVTRFSPANLFAAGEQGVWFDPSDFSTLFQDSAGTTPVTAVGQSVGLMLDKSGRGNHTQQTNNAKRPVLEQDVNGAYYLKGDSVTARAMATSAIDFTGTDKMTVCAGIKKLSDAATGVISELSASSGANFGVFVLGAPWSPASKRFAFNSNGDAGSVAEAATTSTTYNAPITGVLTGLGDISGDSSILRVNGVQAAASTADQGAGNYGNHPIFLFARNQASLYFTGHLYGYVARGAQSSAAQITALENWMNGKTKAYP